MSLFVEEINESIFFAPFFAEQLDQGTPEFLVPGNQETTRPPGNSGKRKEITRKLP
jgi:hypothetical protein